MKIALLGFGVVGKGVFELCAYKEQFEVSHVFCKEPQTVPEGKGTDRMEKILADESIDTFVEVLGGLQPAWTLVSAALQAGKKVVTANKQLVCHYYKEIMELTARTGAVLRCTAAAGGGIPWLSSLERARRCDTIRSISGILNGTTNYILDTMHHSPVPFSEVLASAQRLGYAEADPSADIDGWDICRKLAISANVAFDCALNEQDILTFGIRTVTDADVAAFAAHGYTCKLLAAAGVQDDGSLYSTVEPSLLGPDWPEATVPSNYNLISMQGTFIGKESFFGQGAGRYPTAYNVVQDLLDLEAGVQSFYTRVCRPRPVDNTRQAHRYYLRTAAKSDWLTSHVEKSWAQGGCVTLPVSPAEMHTQAQNLAKSDSSTFFAALL